MCVLSVSLKDRYTIFIFSDPLGLAVTVKEDVF